MPEISINITTDATAVLRKFRGLKFTLSKIIELALNYAANELLQDCRKYVPILTGMLRDSGHLERDLRKYAALLIWDAASSKNNYVYAKKQHEEVLQHINGRFASKWVDKALQENPLKYFYLMTLILRRELRKYVR